MKTSLEHLPEKKQEQLRALGELIRNEAEVEMVILFGSFARGACRPRARAAHPG